MNFVSRELAAKVLKLLCDEGYDKYDQNLVLAQLVDSVGESCVGEHRLMGQQAASCLKRQNVIAGLMDVTDKLLGRGYSSTNPYNYNDMDANLWPYRSKDDVLCLFYEDHGHFYSYIARVAENAPQLHVRKYPYNMSGSKVQEAINKTIEAVESGERGNYEYFRYKDTRDKGFVLSVSYFDLSDIDKGVLIMDCEAMPGWQNAMSTIVEHFPCVFD